MTDFTIGIEAILMLCPICHEERDTVGMTPAYCVTVCVIASCPQFGKPVVIPNLEYSNLIEMEEPSEILGR